MRPTYHIQMAKINVQLVLTVHVSLQLELCPHQIDGIAKHHHQSLVPIMSGQLHEFYFTFIVYLVPMEQFFRIHRLDVTKVLHRL